MRKKKFSLASQGFQVVTHNYEKRFHNYATYIYTPSYTCSISIIIPILFQLFLMHKLKELGKLAYIAL